MFKITKLIIDLIIINKLTNDVNIFLKKQSQVNRKSYRLLKDSLLLGINTKY